MPNARARLAPTTSMITAPTIGQDDLGLHDGGRAGRRAPPPRPQRERRAERGRQRQPDHRVVDFVQRVHR